MTRHDKSQRPAVTCEHGIPVRTEVCGHGNDSSGSAAASCPSSLALGARGSGRRPERALEPRADRARHGGGRGPSQAATATPAWLTGRRFDVALVLLFLTVQAAHALTFATAEGADRLKWDSHLYIGLAEGGYPTGGSPGAPPENYAWYAFHPLYPMLLRGVGALTGLGPASVAVWVNLAGAVLGVGLLSVWLRRRAGRAAALGAVLAAPHVARVAGLPARLHRGVGAVPPRGESAGARGSALRGDLGAHRAVVAGPCAGAPDARRRAARRAVPLVEVP